MSADFRKCSATPAPTALALSIFILHASSMNPHGILSQLAQAQLL
jgi:hypothetical protein